MLTHHPATLPLLLLAAAPLAGDDEATLTFAPREGASRRLSIAVEQSLSGAELEVTMNGSEVPGQFLPEIKMELTDRRELALTETQTESGADGAGEWLRRYDELAWTNEGQMDMSGGGADGAYPWESTVDSPLEGRVLRFASDDGESFDAAPADGEGDEDLLDGVEADLGLRRLLPTDGEPQAIGASWTVSGEGLAQLFEPGGNLGWELPPDMAQYMRLDYEERTHDGSLELTLTKIEGGDAPRAICAVEGKLTRVTVQEGDLSQVPVTDGTATDTVEEAWEVEGQLVWDLAANQVAALTLSGPFLQETHTERDPDQDGPTYLSVFRLRGTHSFQLEREALEGAAVEASVSR
ncbi:MAG: hypothetical protein AAF682_29000 [Planctomycetota bacterium]